MIEKEIAKIKRIVYDDPVKRMRARTQKRKLKGEYDHYFYDTWEPRITQRN